MSEKQFLQYGTWPGVISPKTLAGGLRLLDVQWDTDGQTLVWLERRGASAVLVAQKGNDAIRDVTDPELSVRAGVGYGGGEFTVANGYVYFAANGRLYKQALAGGSAHKLTPRFGGAASPRVSPDGRWLIFVHTYENRDVMALVDTNGKQWPYKLAEGTDFVMQPSWHPDSKQVAYVAWNHPQMPWNGTELRLITLDRPSDSPRAISSETITGDENTAIFQPEFSPDGRYLTYVSDTSGYWHLYAYDLQQKTHTQLTTGEADHAIPAWIQGLHVYGWTHDSTAIYYLKYVEGFVSLWCYEVAQGLSKQVAALEHYTHMDQLSVSPANDTVALISGSSVISPRIVSYSSQTGERIHRRTTPENIPQAELSVAQPVSWTGDDGETVYGIYYAPTSTRFEGRGAPPLIVKVHGGPTSQQYADYRAEAQFFASRGFAVLFPNHRGSTGYGKAYMNKHQGNWGVYDVEDAASGASYLVEQGLADGDKLVIMGGSAGGYTVLLSLVTKPGFYKAGICSYGISNLFLLDMETHKFEAEYNNWLLGPLPDTAPVWRERSPIFHADNIRDNVMIFQGEDDTVVPKNQADAIVAALRAGGVPHEYHVYAGEGHGWRKPETIEDYFTRIQKFLIQYVIYA